MHNRPLPYVIETLCGFRVSWLNFAQAGLGFPLLQLHLCSGEGRDYSVPWQAVASRQAVLSSPSSGQLFNSFSVSGMLPALCGCWSAYNTLFMCCSSAAHGHLALERREHSATDNVVPHMQEAHASLPALASVCGERLRQARITCSNEGTGRR